MIFLPIFLRQMVGYSIAYSFKRLLKSKIKLKYIICFFFSNRTGCHVNAKFNLPLFLLCNEEYNFILMDFTLISFLSNIYNVVLI